MDGFDLLILDDLSYVRRDQAETSVLFELIAERYERKSIAITANYFQLTLMLRLHREATHDPLTGLLNRGALIRSMAQLTARGAAPQAALLMMDLDHFKEVNDQYGHQMGDEVIQKFASIIKNKFNLIGF